MLSLKQLRNGAPCKRRFKLFYQFIDQALQARAETAEEFPISATALQDAAPFQSLVRTLDYIAISAVSRDMAELRPILFNKNRLQPGTVAQVKNLPREPYPSETINADGKRSDVLKPQKAYQRYFDKIIDPTFPADQQADAQTGVALFLQRFPICDFYFHKISEQFSTNIRSALEHFHTNRATLQALFFSGRQIERIQKIGLSGSDTHKGGKQVLILDLAVRGPSSRKSTIEKLVYKPSDVELDYRMCGDTTALADAFDGANPMGQLPSLAEWINTHLPEPTGRQLPTYKILPCNPGSALEANDGVLPIQESYGFIEFLSNEPLRRDASGAPIRADIKNAASSDWLCTDAEAKDHYAVWGKWLAVAKVFSWGDCHSENIITHGKRPCPIDLEITCTGPMESLTGTMLVMNGDLVESVEATGHSRGGLTGRTRMFRLPTVGGDQTANMAIGFINQRNDTYEPSQNRIAVKELGWQIALPRNYMTPIMTAMKDVLRVFAENRNGGGAYIGLIPWITQALGNCVGRFTPFGTGDFTKARNVFISTPNMRGQPPNTPGVSNTFWDPKIDEILKGGRGWPTPRPNAALQQDQNNYADFRNHDVPAYYHRLNSADLLNARGRRVDVSNDESVRRNTYFPANAVGIVMGQIQDLNDDTIDEHINDAIRIIGNQPPQGFFNQIFGGRKGA